MKELQNTLKKNIYKPFVRHSVTSPAKAKESEESTIDVEETPQHGQKAAQPVWHKCRCEMCWT